MIFSFLLSTILTFLIFFHCISLTIPLFICSFTFLFLTFSTLIFNFLSFYFKCRSYSFICLHTAANIFSQELPHQPFLMHFSSLFLSLLFSQNSSHLSWNSFVYFYIFCIDSSPFVEKPYISSINELHIYQRNSPSKDFSNALESNISIRAIIISDNYKRIII